MEHEVAADIANAAHAAAEGSAHLAATGWDALLQNPMTWLGVSFLLFLVVFIKVALPKINAGLDARSAKIRDQLEQASRLRAEAEALLASYQSEREEKAKEAESIVTAAKAEAAEIRTRAEAELKLLVERRSQQALDKIARAETEATSTIRNQMIDIATAAASELIRSSLEKNPGNDNSIANAIKAIESQIR